MNMLSFMNKYGDVIYEKASAKMQPLFDPIKPDNLDFNNLEKLLTFDRKLFKAQSDCVLAISKAFYRENRKSIFLVGEMGTGKSIMGASVAFLNPRKNKRTVVVCPPHLVKKWMREIKIAEPKAKVKILTCISDVELNKKPVGSEYWIMSREKAKLHYKDEFYWEQKPYIELQGNKLKRIFYYEAQKKRRTHQLPDNAFELALAYAMADPSSYESEPMAGVLIEILECASSKLPHKCPTCNTVLSAETQTRRNRCTECGQPLFGASSTGMRRYGLAEYIKRNKNKCFIDLLIADEVHELKGGETAQGQVLHALAVSAKQTLALTGTLMGGYASNLYHLLYRLFTVKMQVYGYRHNSSTEFSSQYGVVEEIIERKTESGRNSSIGKTRATRQVYEKPGISPLILPHFLLEDTVFIGIMDIAADAMPTYDEFVESVKMTPQQSAVYHEFESELIAAVQEFSFGGNNRLLGAMVQSLYALPDGARRGEEVLHPDTKHPFIVAPPIDLPMAPKEAKLLDLIQKEKAEGRRCAVFLEHTGQRDMIPELTDRLKAEGLKALVLRSTTTTTDRREAWILERVKEENPDVLICNPNLVKTGLDLLDFPTIIYFQSGYSIYTLRQSSRRSWRIGQTKPVRVYYLVYAGTAQERAMRLIATKLETSNVVEGRLSADGLSAMSEGTNSLIYDIARSIVDGVADKQSMDDVWKSYTSTNQFSSENFTQAEANTPVKRGDWEASKERQVAQQRNLLDDVESLWTEKAKARKDGTFELSIFDILDDLDEKDESLAA